MATAIDTVADFVAAARVLLQDNMAAYIYPDNDILLGLNLGLQEIARIRPDIAFADWDNFAPPVYAAVNSTSIDLSDRYVSPLLYHAVGWLLIRTGDEKDNARGAAFMKMFRAQLLGEA